MTTPPHGDAAASPRRWARFLRARLDPKSYLGLHFTVGLLLAVLALWLFAGLLEEVLDNATLVHWDMATAARIHGIATSAGSSVFHAITNVGSPPVMTALAVIGVATLLVMRRRLLALVWLAAAGGGAVLDQVLKILVHRTRPEYGAAYLHGVSYSFPSGHAMGSVIGFGMAAFAIAHVWHLSRRERQGAYFLAGLAALLVGLSRVYLGVHYPSDVLGGWAAGGGWLSICITGYHFVTGRAAHLHPEPS
ncbi:MAG: phosphatase PAP2 family protein [Gemmatimonadaceae bacterium]|nr:phosphatase PAP2 family protein [Gemmatimonadaceae bacterium]NUQ91995.1 phosphatase PAP2 family protein [Gemmatimonadaceae bacterium]NUR20692.1 phosphatase PAP2 family protein [Gemmatimonadaceae bacterium]NUS96412.1 phosphatase PAP2 family protein [Gemmatimonadaceae bacterium]